MKIFVDFVSLLSMMTVKKHDYILTPGRYVGFAEEEEDPEEFEEKMKNLTSKLSEQFEKSEELEIEIKKYLRRFGI